MPNRIIRDDWLDSETVNKLDAPAERFFLRLCLVADDFGRFHANPLLLKSSLFPLSETVRSTDIAHWIAACEKAGVVRCYDSEGKRYVQIPKFRQRTRAEISKFPDPPTTLTPEKVQNDGHLSDNCPSGDRPPRTYSETETVFGDGDGKTGARAIEVVIDGITAEAIYAAYPRKADRPSSLKAISKAMTRRPAAWLLERVKAYAVAVCGVEQRYVPHARTWFNGERYNDPESSWNPDGKKTRSQTEEPDGWRTAAQALWPTHLHHTKPWNDLPPSAQAAVIERLKAKGLSE